ncbi:putative clathrin assembly protein [Iris pallida]|uniref:Clathrin assembly protein n=1 Tax=Iris pallida TaxID=29817 RepID=A0AAX6EBI0_IRIPA|nr:putative clathrin assembly protein [Iris pallida]
MAPSSIRKALGAVKDQTSIGIAKVSSNIAPELDVAIVKATSHDDEPADDKYLREILNLTSYSRGYTSACVATVSRRLGKTRDWIVALKALMLVHRLLTEGDPSFHQEILYATRRGTRLLNMADFRDEAHSNSWDHSAFVRTYALYLDQRLELLVYEGKQHGGRAGDGNRPPPYGSAAAARDYGDAADPYGGGSSNQRRSPYHSSPPSARTNSWDAGYDEDRFRNQNQEEKKKADATPLKDMTPEKVLGRMYQLQQLLDRFLACRPTGAAKNSRMVLIALYPVVRESFQLYADICEILAILLDRFFDMEYADCVKSFEAYVSAAKQIDELAAFYGWCKDTGVARSSEYPDVQRITDKLLETLEEFMRDRGRRPQDPPQKAQEVPAIAETAFHEEEEPLEDMNSIKALPAPPVHEEELPPPVVKVEPAKPQQPSQEADLLNLKDDAVSAEDHTNRLALALFSEGGPPAAAAGNGSWEAFPSSGEDSQLTSAWQNPAAEKGKADWELALVESASNLSKQKAALAGGFDQLLLNGMYDQGAVKQHVNAQMSGGSASSVALPGIGRGTTPVLALPAPDGTVKSIGEDPFAASAVVPPPSYVQMSDMEKKQLLLVQEQQLWQHYAQSGMQGQASLAKLNNGYNNYPNPAVPYGMPPFNGNAAGYYYPPY